MTISSETTKTGPYSGNASTTVFAYTFVIYDQTDLEVVVTTTATGSESIRAIGTGSTNYSVSGVGTASGGNVTMVTAPASGETLTIRRKQTLLQGSDFTNQGAYVGETHERVYDETIQKIQQVDEEVERSLKFPVSDAALTSTLPTSAIRAGTYLTFDSSGNVSTTAGASTDATSAAATATTLSGAASTTSLAIGTGSKAFTVASGLAFVAGDYVLATSNADTSNYMHGQIASYSSTTLTLTSANTGGSGTKADWTIRRSGPLGPTGATGSVGADGATGPVGIGLALALG